MENNLFSISAELQDIILQLEEDEATDELISRLSITEDNLKEKIGDYLQVIKRYDNDVSECKKEKDRVNQIQKVRTNTLERLKKLILEAVIMFGNAGKTGNSVIEGSTYRVSTRTVISLVPNDILIADIIKEYLSIVSDYLREADTIDAIDLDILASSISTCLTASKIESRKAMGLPIESEEATVIVTKDDLLAIPIEIIININLHEMSLKENHELLMWLEQNPHKADIVHKVNSTTLKAQKALNADLHICSEEEKTSLIIK